MAKGTNHGFVPEEGTIIHATHRSEDLIPAFYEELFLYRPSVSRWWREEYSDVFAYIDTGNDIPPDMQADASELVHTLMDKLSEEAPEGMYFGAHPGDGSDFGFWRFEEEV